MRITEWEKVRKTEKQLSKMVKKDCKVESESLKDVKYDICYRHMHAYVCKCSSYFLCALQPKKNENLQPKITQFAVMKPKTASHIFLQHFQCGKIEIHININIYKVWFSLRFIKFDVAIDVFTGINHITRQWELCVNANGN